MPVTFNEVPDPAILTPAPRNASGPLGQTAASDLGSLAERAQRRQEQIAQNNPGSRNSLFPIQGAPGVLPNLLGGRGTGQVQNLPGVANSVPNAAVEGSRAQGGEMGGMAEIMADIVPTERPGTLQPEPADTPYTDLSPTQRNSALRRLKMRVNDYISDPETNAPRRSETGASILSFKVDGYDDDLYLAEDGVAAQSALMQATQKAGINARVRRVEDGDLGYTTEWDVAPADRAYFATLLAYFEASDVKATSQGGRVTFSPDHALNRAHMRAPFGRTQKNEGGKR